MVQALEQGTADRSITSSTMVSLKGRNPSITRGSRLPAGMIITTVITAPAMLLLQALPQERSFSGLLN